MYTQSLELNSLVGGYSEDAGKVIMAIETAEKMYFMTVTYST